jgi:hypothetical protein
METSMSKLLAGLLGGMLSGVLCVALSSLSHESSGDLSRSPVSSTGVKMGGASPSRYPPQYVLEPGLQNQAIRTVADAAMWGEGGSGGTGISPLTPDGGIVTCNGTACGANGVTYTPGTGAITFPSSATAPGLAQVSESAAQTPTPMVDTPQVSTHATDQDGSRRGIALSAPLGSGVEGSWYLTRAGSPIAFLGEVPGYAPNMSGVWLANAISPITTPSYANASIRLYGSGLQLNSQSYIGFYPSAGAEVFGIYTGLVEVGTAQNGSAYGGTNEIVIDNGTASTSQCTGATCLGSVASTGLIATSAVFDRDTFQSVTSGTHNTQALYAPLKSNMGTTTAGAGTYSAITFPLASGTFCVYEFGLYLKLITPGTAGGTAGNALSSIFRCGFENQAGTISVVGGASGCQQSTDPGNSWADTAMVSALTGVNGTTGTNTVTVGFMTASTSGVMDWIAHAHPGQSYCE